jgi:hypothetical protein
MNRLPVLAGLIVCLVFYAVGEYLSKLWSLRPSNGLALATVAAYALSALAWLPALRAHGSLTVLTTIFAVCTALAGIVIGLSVFREPVTARQLAGIGFALVALILLY